MKRYFIRLQPREMVLAAAVVLLICSFVIGRAWLLPSYDAWSGSRAAAQVRQMEFEKLSLFVDVRDEVAREHALLGEDAFLRDPEQIELSRFLRRVEEFARHPSMTIVSAKPSAFEKHEGYWRFPVRLSVAGPLVEVTQFVVELLNGTDVVGMESFSLRGVQGGHQVECSISIWLVRVAPLAGGVSGS